MKRVISGTVLIAAGIVLMYLPLALTMTGLVFIGFGMLFLADYFFEKQNWKRVWRVAIRTIGIAVLVILVTAMSYIGTQGISQWDEAVVSEYAVVLGAQVKGDQPSRTLQLRLDKALEFMQVNETAIIIVSGGQGDDESYPEAVVMANYLERHGADMSRVYQEPEARNTRENLSFSAEIAASVGINPANLTIITSEFHMCRAKYIARSLEMNAHGVSSETTPWILMLNYLLREVFAFVKAFFVVHAA